MSELYPLLLLPEFHERVWGSRDISLLYPHKSARRPDGQFEQPIGEVWLTGDECRVANGALAGQTLAEVTKRFGRELLGDAAADVSRFPLLMKFLMPKEKLSVQVHPDDDGARAIGQACGKTECWYVLAAEAGAQVGLGLKHGVSRDEVKKAIVENRLEPLMNWIDVKPGDLIYVDAGTIHAIGPGSIIVETQQNSDTTYRLYDYGRGRELHIEQGMGALKEKTHAGKVERMSNNGVVNLVSSPSFIVDKFVVKEPKEFQANGEKTSAQVLVALEGCGVVEADGMKPVTLAKGECLVLPAEVKHYRIQPQWALECLRASLPTTKVSEPVAVIA
ncbi:MAG TPA: type I phosphomannose isomerase catalytic subunit [Terriglobales bacterium]|nr:type I phosphomannose isomerase catalytic subunit [Terriglobales bacterium]